LAAIVGKYRNTYSNGCVAWTLPDVLNQVSTGHTNWLVVTNGLLQVSHFTELQNVLGQLTEPRTCCCAVVVMNPSSTGTNQLPDGMTCLNYLQTISASGGVTPYTFAIISNSLPPGLTLTNISDSSTSITGTPTTVGSNYFEISATDTNGCATNQWYGIAISRGPIALYPPPTMSTNIFELPPGCTNQEYQTTITAGGVTAPYTFAITSGSLPSGLGWTNATGSSMSITGMPTSVGSNTFVITATPPTVARPIKRI